jgi:hypothetical protein
MQAAAVREWGGGRIVLNADEGPEVSAEAGPWPGGVCDGRVAQAARPTSHVCSASQFKSLLEVADRLIQQRGEFCRWLIGECEHHCHRYFDDGSGECADR